MEETELQLSASGSGVFDASGNMQFTLGANDLSRWQIKLITWSCTSTKITDLRVYRGVVSATKQLDFTQALSDVSPTDITLQQGEYLVFRATGGDVGTVGTIVVEGSRFLKGKRIY